MSNEREFIVKRPKKNGEPGVRLADMRTVVATIRHDLKVGNLEHARTIARLAFATSEDFDPNFATPRSLRWVCDTVSAKLDEMEHG